MKYKSFGPFEITLDNGRRKTKIDNEDIREFWRNVNNCRLENGCGVYIFSIKTSVKEKIWYVGKAQKQSFAQECFTRHKLDHYHEALKSNRDGAPRMYFLARMKTKRIISPPTESRSYGFPEMDFVENMFIAYGYKNNNRIKNTQDTKIPKDLVIEGFYNSEDRRRTSTKHLFEILEGN